MNLSISLSGMIPWLWKNRQSGELETLIITNSRGGRNPTKHILESFLFLTSVLAFNKISYLHPDFSSLKNPLAFTLHTIFKDGMKSWRYEIPNQEWGKKYLQMVVGEFLFNPEFDFLPFEIFTNKKVALETKDGPVQPFSTNTKLPLELKSQYAKLLRESLEDENIVGSFRCMTLLEILDIEVPEDAFDKIQRRVGPVFQLLKDG